ncbi:IclR family transcriptional regulator domain-containing protein [Salinarimonas ramus]|uniref:IclR family transcriptional regulator n=1 Tax=Salinarimonas ramus TaxID=690164 RepID=A0A917QHG2_9HYPH|nr:IclR family transcriptional regulator C-terminal domain-containing protein [Salinarimonas ramus]GGK50920.1 IclR family transcriptional regulator [Salinarimonas ramus]
MANDDLRDEDRIEALPDVTAESGNEDRDYVTSLARGLEVIRAFNRSKSRMTLSEVAERTAMTRAAVRRFLLTLVREGYAESDGKYFRLRPKVLELGFSLLSSMDITEIMQPVVDELAQRLQESVFVAVLDDDAVRYVARATTQRVVSIGINLGSRAPAHAVSTGRVLLSGLPEEKLNAYLDNAVLEKITPHTVTSKVQLASLIEETRRQGWAIVDQELEVGLRSISAPIKNRSGEVVAALNVCCPSVRLTTKEMQAQVLPELLDAASRISLMMLR